MTPSEAMKRVEEIDNELGMYERVRLPRPDGSGKPLGQMTEHGLECEQELKDERAELVRQYGN